MPPSRRWAGRHPAPKAPPTPQRHPTHSAARACRPRPSQPITVTPPRPNHRPRPIQPITVTPPRPNHRPRSTQRPRPNLQRPAQTHPAPRNSTAGPPEAGEGRPRPARRARASLGRWQRQRPASAFAAAARSDGARPCAAKRSSGTPLVEYFDTPRRRSLTARPASATAPATMAPNPVSTW